MLDQVRTGYGRLDLIRSVFVRLVMVTSGYIFLGHIILVKSSSVRLCLVVLG